MLPLHRTNTHKTNLHPKKHKKRKVLIPSPWAHFHQRHVLRGPRPRRGPEAYAASLRRSGPQLREGHDTRDVGPLQELHREAGGRGAVQYLHW